MSRLGRLLSGLLLAILLAGAGYFSFGLYRKHRSVHGENRCVMTFMWRQIFLTPIPVPNYDGSRYSLIHYTEGVHVPADFVGGASDIPVLFVPGSGGSGRQVRSLASVMQNKTEMRRAPFRMHFYALDFDEEISALSGNTLIRQRDFLVRSIDVLRKKYPKTKDKMILFGHSFGGVVIRSLPLHPDFKPNQIGLVLTLAAPLLQSPITLDFPMANFYHEVEELWEQPSEDLKNIRFFSFSGGEKDFLVPDRLVAADQTIHLPSWSIPGVETPVDHLCVLWCNQLVRYMSRILFTYGDEALSEQNPTLTLAVADEFQAKESARLEKLREIVTRSGAKDPSSAFIWAAGQVGSDSNPAEMAYRVELPSNQVYRIHVQCKDSRGHSCSEKLGVTILHPSGWTAFGENSRHHGIRVKTVLLRPVEGKHRFLILQAPEANVDYTITVEADFMGSWYMILTNCSFDLISAVISTVVLAIPLVSFTGIGPFALGVALLTASALGIALLLFHYYVLAIGIVGILFLIGEAQPLLGLLAGTVNHHYFCLFLALLHPDLAIISVFLRNPKTKSCTIHQILLVLTIATILPSIFEGGRPKLVLPLPLYHLGKDITIVNPSWLVVAAEFFGSQLARGLFPKVLAIVPFYSCFILLLSGQLFDQSPILLYPSLLAHISLFFRFYPAIFTWLTSRFSFNRV